MRRGGLYGISDAWIRGLNPATTRAACLTAWRNVEEFFDANVAGGMAASELAGVQAPVVADEAGEIF